MVIENCWSSETPELFTTSKWDWANRVWLYLIVEAMPDGRWDWAAWANDNTCRSVHGVTPDRAGAMAQAEQGAELIKRVRVLAA